jgi:hypothetical protein
VDVGILTPSNFLDFEEVQDHYFTVASNDADG